MRRAIVVWGVVVMVAALYTGAANHFYFRSAMTGLLPPHYGYSAYAMVPVLFLARWRGFRYMAAAALLASSNRAAWLGALVGALWRRPMLALILAALAAFGGLFLKPAVVRARTDNVRVQIWKATWHLAKTHPRGIGHGNYLMFVAGREVDKAHSDVLQLLVEEGFLVTGLVFLLLGVALYAAPAGPSKNVVVALTTQSVMDNRLHHPACVALYAAAWLLVWHERRTPRRVGSRPSTTGSA